MKLNARQRDILLHMTGLDRSKTPTRTHFATEAASADWSVLDSLVCLGLVRHAVPGGGLFGGLWFFHVSEEGVAAAMRIKADSGCPDCAGGTFSCPYCGKADWTCGTCGGISCGRPTCRDKA